MTKDKFINKRNKHIYKKTIFILAMMFLSIVFVSCDNTITPTTSNTVTPTAIEKPSRSPETTATAEPSVTSTPTFTTEPDPEPEPEPVIIPEGATYIPFYDIYADLTSTDDLSKNAIGWSKNDPVSDVLKKHNVTTTTDESLNRIYLTFNLGYEHVRGNTEKLLEILDKRDIKATFFIVGEYMEVFPEKVRAIFDGEHTIGCHSYYHFPASNTMTDEEYIDDFIKTEQLLMNALGDDYTRMRYYRPISGEFCERDLYIAGQLGYKVVLFDATYNDWNRTITHGFDYAYAKLVEDIHQGAIYQLHIVTSDNIEALPVFLDELISDGWSFSAFE